MDKNRDVRKMVRCEEKALVFTCGYSTAVIDTGYIQPVCVLSLIFISTDSIIYISSLYIYKGHLKHKAVVAV